MVKQPDKWRELHQMKEMRLQFDFAVEHSSGERSLTLKRLN